ncbi:molybdopterin converting factor subunit 1 [candidate division KSB1 bacterium]|nr:molybdopterin converting factor subunit 1 [candidate division KSB1 bacterium]NIR71391.1 molybdopterin converting factor subunit 1 [candidate division KSB1 bacterium]NIS26285.1 molybdopterin converting factor subunit 1 [candidate division KSB1 bacterium]NIT73047.1 molybdopterin converting factor subunit 1 [candidate division KSB1 bacterium]NIU26955.1 molybdopterin converting factor subunit 1 [candidate division KSB1 bacterium]
MKIKLRFFGQLRDLTKRDEIELEVQNKTTVGDLIWLVGERFPQLREHLKVVSFAVDNEYATKDSELKDGNEVGLLPPISGGSHG